MRPLAHTESDSDEQLDLSLQLLSKQNLLGVQFPVPIFGITNRLHSRGILFIAPIPYFSCQNARMNHFYPEPPQASLLNKYIPINKFQYRPRTLK